MWQVKQGDKWGDGLVKNQRKKKKEPKDLINYFIVVGEERS